MSKPRVAVLLLLLASAPAVAQTQFAVNITDVAVEQLTNGLRITVKADGLLVAQTTGNWYQTNEDYEFPVWLANAHSSVGTFVDISSYPVNYQARDALRFARGRWSDADGASVPLCACPQCGS